MQNIMKIFKKSDTTHFMSSYIGYSRVIMPKTCRALSNALFALLFFGPMSICCSYSFLSSGTTKESEWDYVNSFESPHSCVILSADQVRCWGMNWAGQLGYGHTENIGIPALAGDVIIGDRVIQVAVGRYHTCVLLRTGGVRCWGYNSEGQLGYGHTSTIGDDEMPASAGDVNLGGAVTQIAAGSSHTCALLTGGAVRCWGLNSYGQLGYGHTNTIGDDEMPASAGGVDMGVGVTATQITAGEFHTCALLDTGNVRCWGNNSRVQLGYGHANNIGDDEMPASAGDVDMGVGVTVTQIAAGEYYTCALLSTGGVRCWAVNSYGQLGYGQGYGGDHIREPASAGDVDMGVGVTATQIALGKCHTCALLSTGGVRCWGLNYSGQLGYGHTEHIGDDETPYGVGDVIIGGRITQIAVGWGNDWGDSSPIWDHGYSCALLDTGYVRCWGQNYSGQLGYGHTNNIGDDEAPADVGEVDVGAPVIKLWGDLLR